MMHPPMHVGNPFRYLIIHQRRKDYEISRDKIAMGGVKNKIKD